MSDDDRIKALMALASDDLRSAELLLERVPRLAAYHLQQAAEKIAKALLVHDGVDPQRVHQIGRLAHELGSGHPLRPRLLELDRLTVYGTEMRYPQPSGRLPKPPGEDGLRKDAEAVSALHKAARAYLKLEPTAEDNDDG